ncbi:hypothetical protein [Metabacillus sp. RGM 3146]|uniref:hypothetical protein n=1 Tax=Metabacillus sp. RGM 3146 TaxID=3401092 RepID=UPI003B991215
MAIKGLVYKELRNSILIIPITIAVLALHLPYIIWEHYALFDQQNIHVFDKMIIGPLVLLPFFLAIRLIGGEKRHSVMDFTLSLPYSRSHIFWTKWLIGALSILISLLLSFSLSQILLQYAHARIDGSLLHFLFYTGSMLLLVFTVVFTAGCFAGTSFSQAFLSWGIFMFPSILLYLVWSHIQIFTGSILPSEGLLWEIRHIFSGNQFLFYNDQLTYPQIGLYLAIVICFLLVGYFSFLKLPAERNGNFFLWKHWNVPFLVLIGIFGVFWFALKLYSGTGKMTGGYIAGILIGAFLLGIAVYRIRFKKTKLVKAD